MYTPSLTSPRDNETTACLTLKFDLWPFDHKHMKQTCLCLLTVLIVLKCASAALINITYLFIYLFIYLFTCTCNVHGYYWAMALRRDHWFCHTCSQLIFVSSCINAHSPTCTRAVSLVKLIPVMQQFNCFTYLRRNTEKFCIWLMDADVSSRYNSE